MREQLPTAASEDTSNLTSQNRLEPIDGDCFDSYRLVRKIGSGGMGVVYLAEDRELKRLVALKLLPKEILCGQDRVQRFQREAQVASQLVHPNILTVHCVGQNQQFYYIVTEFVDGETLRRKLHDAVLSLQQKLEIIIQIALALGAAHRAGVVHRDIKPENVMIRPDGLVKVLDFGLAKLIETPVFDDSDANSFETRQNILLGTPNYMSPEQATGDRLDARADLFSLGALVYECLAGKPPFRGAAAHEIIAQIISRNPAPPSASNPQIPPELDVIALKLLAKNPAERFQTADELIVVLRAAIADLNSANQIPTLAFQPEITAPVRAVKTKFDFVRPPFPRAPLAVGAAALLFAILLFVAPLPRADFAASPAAQKLFDAGAAAVRDGAYYKAAKILEDAVAADENFALAHARLAEAWSELDYTQRAQNEMLRARKLQREQQTFWSGVYKSDEAIYFDAIDAMVRRDFAEAVKIYGALHRAQPDKAYYLVDLARATEKNEQIAAAIELYEKAAILDQQSATAFLRLGALRNRTGDAARAALDFDRAEKIYDRTSDDEGVAEVKFQRGTALNLQDKHEAARREFEQVLNAPRASRHQQIKAMLQISSLCSGAGDTTCAVEFAEKAVNLAKQERMENLATTGLIDLGNAYFARGAFEQAETQFQQALSLAKNDGGQRNAARVLLALGSLRIEQNKPAEAQFFVGQALPYYQQGGYSREISQAQVLLGLASEYQNDYAAALRFYAQAEQFDDPTQRAMVQTVIGGVLRQQEKFPQALTRFEQSLAFYNSTGNHFSAAYSLLSIADLQIRLGRFEKAKEFLAAAEKTVAETSGATAHLLVEAVLFKAQMLLVETDAAAAVIKNLKPLSASSDTRVAIEAKRLTCLAQLRLGVRERANAVETCRDALRIAIEENRQSTINAARLALAEAELNHQQFAAAAQLSMQVKKDCLAAEQHESAWRAALIAARAAEALGDRKNAREHAAQALALLAHLEPDLGAEFYDVYLKRPDTAVCQAQAKQIAQK